MLHPDDPARPLDPALREAPGGFAWWYADALDDDLNGLVLIAAWGLPFLPGDRAARLAGAPRRPGDRPSLNLVLYRRGRPVFYTLYELRPEQATWTDCAWRFGDSRLWLEEDGDTRTLRGEFVVPVPGGRVPLTGTLAVCGRRTRLPVPAPPNAHAWSPMMGAGRCQARFALGDEVILDLRGSGYHDRNGSRVPLDGLGLDHWTWGRHVVGDTLVVHYLNWPASPDAQPVHHLVTVGSDGAIVTRKANVTLDEPSRTAFGMRWWRHVEVEAEGERLQVRHDTPVDRGPFYLRCTTTATFRGATARGWAELCRPDRVDLARHRFLVNMAVDRAAGPTSMWLPLFVGPRADRVVRLLRWWAWGWT